MISITNLSLCIGQYDDYAIQHQDGHYTRAFRPLSPRVLTAHLAGELTIGTYVRDAQGYCRFAVFDADQEDGLALLLNLQEELARENVPSYIERSRRGGHLWIFFREPVLADHVRAWLWPLACAQGLELYPKQGHGQGIGSLIRVPLGIHRKSGRRYPFVDAQLNPVAPTLRGMLDWLGTVKLVTPPPLPPLLTPPSPDVQPFLVSAVGPRQSIRKWNAQHDPLAFIGRFVRLNSQGIGHCPFGWHHAGGCDTHASFKVYRPRTPGGYCWYCYTWEHGGSVFDFLRYWYNLDARELWHRIQAGKIDGI
jgi:hypothetical protein